MWVVVIISGAFLLGYYIGKKQAEKEKAASGNK
jgi:uncharacterized protein YneF (UPF0154 family)